MKISSANSKRLISVISGCLLLAAALGFWVASRSSAGTDNAGLSAAAEPMITTAPASAARVCGQRILRSPYDYHGKTGSFRSGARGLPTFGKPGTTFPADKAGVILPSGTHFYPSYKLRPYTVYYLLPGVHVTTIQADVKDAFVGGYWKGKGTTLDGKYANGGQAIDSNETLGNQRGVSVEYLTIERYMPNGNAAAVNQEANSGWLVQFNTITLNVPGAGVILGTANVLRDNCLTLNGQYGFQSTASDGYDRDALTGGPYGVTVTGNEISYNDTCDYSGRLNNKAVGWSNFDPVPAQYRNSRCGTITPDGDQGGFKLWRTNGVTIAGNYIHNNWGPGGWADTDNANTTWLDNTITGNESEGIIEEVSYNFSITGNYIADNDWTDGLNNPDFPQPAIYISESGSDTDFGGVPACAGPSCKKQPSYVHQSPIRNNTLVNNGGGVFLWQSSNRFCSDGFDTPCTLIDGGPKGPFTVAHCAANLPTAAISLITFQGETTGSPAEDWWDGCKWRTANVAVTGNTFDFNPAAIPHCTAAVWRDCGAGGVFSQYATPTASNPGWVVPTQITFFQGNTWSDNTYNGPLRLYVWNEGNGDNPVTWADWTGPASNGNKCTAKDERQSGYCSGPFGQDAGGTYHPKPVP